ncbi:Rab GTPase-activating protein 22-like protein, partial [Drosera capensis]
FLLLFQPPEKACPPRKIAGCQSQPPPWSTTCKSSNQPDAGDDNDHHHCRHIRRRRFKNGIDPTFLWISQTIGDELTSMEAASLRDGCVLGAKLWLCVITNKWEYDNMFCITAECRHGKPSCINVRLNKMLKPEKWQAASDGNGRVCGFQKLLKLIVLGGVDPSIRPEVWEFLLGCYALNTTAEYRRKLRTAR